ncbi:MAG: hypothetical protein NZO58_07800 [Gemmataceae bacterium]|nr:hypothetical protein [Gemmataceae bacterium]
MPITLTCPTCAKPCAVRDEYAGMQVRCPSCSAIINVPAPSITPLPAVPLPATPEAARPTEYQGTTAPPPPPSGPSFADKLLKFLAAHGVNQTQFILLLVGIGCMGLFLIAVLLPWFRLPIPAVSRLGIQTGIGLVEFLLVLGVLFLLTFVILLEWHKLFDYALWTASNLSMFIVLHLLALIGDGASVGLILALVAMSVAAGTLATVTFPRVFVADTARGAAT